MPISFNSAIPPYPNPNSVFNRPTKKKDFAPKPWFTYENYKQSLKDSVFREKTKRANTINELVLDLLDKNPEAHHHHFHNVLSKYEDVGKPTKGYIRYHNKIADIIRKNPPEVAVEKVIGYITRSYENLVKHPPLKGIQIKVL